MKEYDAVIIGGGHNGLVCANYMARAGLSVKVFEMRPVIGGACVTEEIAEGYHGSTLAYSLGQMPAQIIEELKLKDFGLELIKQKSGAISLLPEGRHLIITDDHKETHAQISKFSTRDADAHLSFRQEIQECYQVLQRFRQDRPPNYRGGIGEIMEFFKTGQKFRRLSVAQKEKIMNIMTMSLGDYLDLWFESEEVKGFYAAFGVIGNFVHPYSAGSAFALLSHLSDLNGKSMQVKGGMGNLGQALAESAKAQGVEIQTDARVEEVVTDISDNKNRSGLTYGIKLENGEFIKAKRVIANCTPYILFNDLLKAEHLPSGFLKRMRKYKYSSGSLKINLALSELPEFTSLTSQNIKPEFYNRPINICPSLNYAERAFHDGRIRGFARKPIISMVIHSIADKTLAPDGHYVASLLCQHFNKNLPDELTWPTIRDEAVEDVFDVISHYAPNFRNAVLHHQVITPQDLEKTYGFTGGDLHHGAMQLNQMFSYRPAAKFADYRTPVKDLYLCGAGAHPGGGVSGLPGMLCAREVLKDSAQ